MNNPQNMGITEEEAERIGAKLIVADFVGSTPYLSRYYAIKV